VLSAMSLRRYRISWSGRRTRRKATAAAEEVA